MAKTYARKPVAIKTTTKQSFHLKLEISVRKLTSFLNVKYRNTVIENAKDLKNSICHPPASSIALRATPDVLKNNADTTIISTPRP